MAEDNIRAPPSISDYVTIGDILNPDVSHREIKARLAQWNDVLADYRTEVLKRIGNHAGIPPSDIVAHVKAEKKRLDFPASGNAWPCVYSVAPTRQATSAAVVGASPSIGGQGPAQQMGDIEMWYNSPDNNGDIYTIIVAKGSGSDGLAGILPGSEGWNCSSVKEGAGAVAYYKKGNHSVPLMADNLRAQGYNVKSNLEKSLAGMSVRFAMKHDLRNDDVSHFMS